MATKSFTGVTAAMWDRMKAQSTTEHGTVYDPPGHEQGTATTKTPVGDVVLRFAFDAAKSTVTYTIDKKPFIVTEGQIWSGVQGSIDHLSRG